MRPRYECEVRIWPPERKKPRGKKRGLEVYRAWTEHSPRPDLRTCPRAGGEKGPPAMMMLRCGRLLRHTRGVAVNFLATSPTSRASWRTRAASGLALWRRAPMAANLALTSRETMLRVRQRRLTYL